MPTYQYACTECDHRFEAVQAFSDASLTTCPVCGGKLRKVYGSVGVVFKGSGFYRTDSRSGAVDAAAKSDKADAAKSDAPAKKTEATPDKSADKASSTPAASSSGGSSGSGSSTGGTGKAAS
ncbi:FmdB family transcriptional regulator [Nakamurella flavida]|uniref:FmdB family transcriptional regulator n=1 Tax=Nakamurella flavida TaxID=363630 RepID=A0A938YNB8_9ACTN|nr:FmdB family zinc ribbon protein [Nakamurella flavida]MBM9476213.1 FmdB family transcriptional regulator [Nakamurella flavida]MDP9779689.1 putative FmdB family regulatory protein [Nakamurella flavida]